MDDRARQGAALRARSNEVGHISCLYLVPLVLVLWLEGALQSQSFEHALIIESPARAGYTTAEEQRQAALARWRYVCACCGAMGRTMGEQDRQPASEQTRCGCLSSVVR
jgi:hypothetical protein